MPTPSTDLAEIRTAALRNTWVYVRRNSPYYARALPDLPTREITLDRLREVPLLEKADLTERSEEVRCSRGLPAYVVFTGGTTGTPIMVSGSEEELGVGLPADDGERLPQRLALSTGGGQHGYIPQIPGLRGFLQVPLQSRANYEWALQLLDAEHQFRGYEPKVSMLLLPLPAIKKLLHLVLEREHDASRFALRVICSYAWYVSRAWRQRIEHTFRAPLIDHFGFTELHGALARECPTCGYYHYGAEVVWEVLDGWSDRPIEEGVGRLVVTSLLPASRDMVLIRYVPGDLVELGPFCSEASDRGFRPCGRMANAVDVHVGGCRNWVLLPTQVQEIVDSHHWIARLAEPRFAGITATSDDTFAKWRIRRLRDEAGPILQLELEMKSSPALFSEEWDRFAMRVRCGLMDANRDLERLSAAGLLRFRVVGLPPGAIPDEDVVLC